MLGLKFNLTPAQTEALLVIANDAFREIDGGGLLPDWDSSYFVTTYQRLMAKGLVTHDGKRNPSWQATDEGRAMARIVERQCEHLLSYRAKKQEASK